MYFFDFAVLWLLHDVTQLHQSQARFRMLFELSSVRGWEGRLEGE